MTVVNPKSISGINSITTGSGSDNLLTIHTNDGTERVRIDSTGTTKIVTGIVTTLTATTGIVTTLTANTVTSLGDVDIADKIIHTGDTDTAIRFPSADTITAETAGSERLRITSGGYVGVNQTAPESKLTVFSTDRHVQQLMSETGITAGTTSGTIYRQQYTSAGTSRRMGFFGIKRDGGSGDQRASFVMELCPDNSTSLGLASPASDTTAFEFTRTGRVVVKNGGGIDFSATGDATGMTSELLDDYEEGTWSPALSFGGGSTGITYTNRGGNYTKIGRQVTLNFMMELSSKGSSTGDAVVGGLPYTVADLLAGTVIEASGASSYWNNIEPDLMFLAFSASTSNSQLTPRFQPETGASDAVDSLDNSHFTNSTNFRGSITYFTT